MSNPRFPLHLTVEERKALRVAAANADMTMTDFVRAAITEKIARHADPTRTAPAEPAAQHQKSGANG